MKTPSLLALLSLIAIGSVARAEPAPTQVMVFDHAQVDNAFAKGLLISANDSFKILAGRRVAPGAVEIHDRDTDVFYVQQGSATFVTGGTAMDAKPSGPGEIRGATINGGTVRHLTKGDVIVIPTGVPHQFTEVSDTFLYFVVKVTK